MNLVALIGEVASEVRTDGDGVAFAIAVIGRRGSPSEVVRVQVHGAQGSSCGRYLSPGQRVAVEGRVVPGANPAEVVADRVQFLTSRVQRRGAG